jgi:hypothetical protein
MKKAILLVLISVNVASCATLREWFGSDPLPDQAVCPTLPYYEEPKLTNVNGKKFTVEGTKYIGFTQAQMSDLGDNFAALKDTIDRYQKAVSTYNAAYTTPTD